MMSNLEIAGDFFSVFRNFQVKVKRLSREGGYVGPTRFILSILVKAVLC